MYGGVIHGVLVFRFAVSWFSNALLVFCVKVPFFLSSIHSITSAFARSFIYLSIYPFVHSLYFCFSGAPVLLVLASAGVSFYEYGPHNV